VDEIIIFHALGKKEIEKIVELQLLRLSDRLQERQITLEVMPAARALLADLGYEPAYGARPLKRTIQREVMDPLALQILEGKYKEGDTARIDAADGQFTFQRS
jgi:ATP-dependent Clp protease ATP-binding subunit ClpB